MKKMITVATCLLFAVVSQAAQIKWGVANNSITWISGLSGNSVVAGSVSYALVAGDSNLAAFTDWLDNLTGNAVPTASAMLGKTGVVEWSASTGAKGLLESHESLDSPYLVGGTYYNFYLVAFDVGTDGLNYYAVSGKLVEQAYVSGDEIMVLPWAVANVGITSASQWNEIGAIPEPTAMALLALGAAAVGLRRRFRG